MKIFISQPMNGKSDEEIMQERKEIIKVLEDRFGKDNTEFIDSFFDDTVLESNYDANIPVFLLGESIKKLSQADLVYFAKDWNKARGCRIEYIIASEYGINIEL